MPVDLKLQSDFEASSQDVSIAEVVSSPVNKQIEIILSDRTSGSEADKIISAGSEISIILGSGDTSAANNQNSRKDAGAW